MPPRCSGTTALAEEAAGPSPMHMSTQFAQLVLERRAVTNLQVGCGKWRESAAARQISSITDLSSGGMNWPPYSPPAVPAAEITLHMRISHTVSIRLAAHSGGPGP